MFGIGGDTYTYSDTYIYTYSVGLWPPELGI